MSDSDDVVKCRAKVSPDCQDGRPLLNSEYFQGGRTDEEALEAARGLYESDGLYDGESVICTACYVKMGMPSVDVQKGPQAAVRRADDQLAILKEFIGHQETEERELDFYKAAVDAFLEFGTRTVSVEFTLGELMLYQVLLDKFGSELISKQPLWVNLMDKNVERLLKIEDE